MKDPQVERERDLILGEMSESMNKLSRQGVPQSAFAVSALEFIVALAKRDLLSREEFQRVADEIWSYVTCKEIERNGDMVKVSIMFGDKDEPEQQH